MLPGAQYTLALTPALKSAAGGSLATTATTFFSPREVRGIDVVPQFPFLRQWLSLNAQGTRHLLTIDPTRGIASYSRCAAGADCSVASAWQTANLETGSTPIENSGSIAVDRQGRVHITYYIQSLTNLDTQRVPPAAPLPPTGPSPISILVQSPECGRRFGRMPPESCTLCTATGVREDCVTPRAARRVRLPPTGRPSHCLRRSVTFRTSRWPRRTLVRSPRSTGGRAAAGIRYRWPPARPLARPPSRGRQLRCSPPVCRLEGPTWRSMPTERCMPSTGRARAPHTRPVLRTADRPRRGNRWSSIPRTELLYQASRFMPSGSR